MVPCPECGFDWDAISAADAITTLRGLARRYQAPLTRFLPGEDGVTILVVRPEPAVWSALEYAAHTRDALEFYGDRIRRVLEEDRPQLSSFDFEAACEERHYAGQDPAEVVSGLGDVATRLADQLEGLADGAWERAGISEDGEERSLLLLARRAAHEGVHHLLDIGRVLRRVRQGEPDP